MMNAVLVSSFDGGDPWRETVAGERRVTVRRENGDMEGDVRIVTECDCDKRQKMLRQWNTPLPLCINCGGWFDRWACVCNKPVQKEHRGLSTCGTCGGSRPEGNAPQVGD